ncbi:MAG: hypothetical protein WBN04_04980 [Paracoccaceae bacterium]
MNAQTAALTRAQYEDYKTRFQPVENQVLGSIMNAEGGLGNQAVLDDTLARTSANVNNQYDVAEGSMRRNMGRMGINMTPEREQVAARGLDLGRTLSEVSARNNARTAVKDRDLTTAANMVGLGRGIAADANSTMGANASLEASRNATNQSLSAQNQANNFQGAASLAGLGIAAYAAF